MKKESKSTKIKRCVGAIIYNENGEIFLMSSGKWKGKYLVPGGEILPNESDKEAIIREIREEMNIEITNIKKIGEKIKPPSNDFIDQNTEFHFIDFIALAKSTNITPNHEIDTYDWLDPEHALEKLDLIDSTKNFIQKYISIKNQK